MDIPVEIVTGGMVAVGGIVTAIVARRSTDKKTSSDLGVEQLRLAMSRIKDQEERLDVLQSKIDHLTEERDSLLVRIASLEARFRLTVG